MLQGRKVAVSRPDEVNYFFGLPNPTGRTRPWGTRKRNMMFLESRGRPVRKADFSICDLQYWASAASSVS
jgi:hypothetical protein